MIEIILAALAGLLIGSFLNVCIYRLPLDLSVVRPRSFCPRCEKPIAWYDNIPIASYLLLSGRCRHCKARISARYPLVEAATAIAFALAVWKLGLTLAALKLALFAAALITLTLADLEERILPDEFTIGGTIAGLVLSVFVPMQPELAHMLLPWSLGERWLSLGESVLGAGFAAGSMWLVRFAYEKIRHREGMGLGDLKMIAMIGVFLGLQGTLLTLIVASLLGAVGGLVYILITRKDISTYELPFGTFLGAAALLVALFGSTGLVWYASVGR